jgi:uncharacterized protein (DUF58 family)
MDLWKDKRLRLSITRLGAEYLAALLLLGSFAVSTGNNLLYLVFSLMLGLFLVSGWLGRRAIRDLELVGIEEGNLFARVQGGVKVRYRDRAPGRMRGLEVRLEAALARVEPGFLAGGEGDGELALQVFPERRGPCRVARLELRSGFPFGFIERAWSIPLDREWLVLPHPRRFESGADAEGGPARARPRPRAGSSSPDGARPFKEGDPLCRVHWKRTAQRGAPWVRTFEDEQAAGLRLRLDLRVWEPGSAFERELEFLAGGVLRARLQRRAVSLWVQDGPAGAGYEGYAPCWRALALARARGALQPAGSALP